MTNPRLIIFALILVAPPFLKRWLLRWYCGARIARHARISWFSAVVGSEVELGEHAYVMPFTLIWADGGVRIGAYSEVSSFALIYGSGAFRIGRHCYVGPMSMINTTEDVTFGDVVAIGPRTMIFTHGSFLPYTDGYWVRFAPVTIGSYVWLAAGVYVPPGIRIGDRVFAHPRSVIADDVPDGSVVSGHPAKEVDRMERLQREMNPRRLERAIGQVVDHFAEVWPTLGRGLRREGRDGQRYLFRYRGRRYGLQVLSPGQGPVDFAALRRGVSRLVLVVHEMPCAWEELPRGVYVFDLSSMQTTPPRDPLHQWVHRFMNWYYGVKFSLREEPPPSAS